MLDRTVHIMLDRTPTEKRPPGLVLKINFGAYVGGTGLNCHMIGLGTDSTESNSVTKLLIIGIRRSVRTKTIIVRCKLVILSLICPCIANIFAEYNQQDATFHSLFL